MSQKDTNGTTQTEDKQAKALAVFESWSNLTPERITQAIPKSCGLTAERFMMIAFKLYHQLPKLKDCTQTSVGMSILTAAELGLELGSGLGQGWLLPFSLKGKLTAVLIIGYQGFVELFYRSGLIKNIYSVVVFEDDHFEYEMGLNLKLIHRPKAEAKNKTWEKFTHAYVVFEFTNGGKHFGVMTHAEVQAIKNASPGAKRSDSPWNHPDWWPEMVKKSVLKREGKYVPKSAEVARAIAADNEQYEYEGEVTETNGGSNGGGVKGLKAQTNGQRKKKQEPVDAESETVPQKVKCKVPIFQSDNFKEFEMAKGDSYPPGDPCPGPCGKQDKLDEGAKPEPIYTCSSPPEKCERATNYARQIEQGKPEPAQATLPTDEEPELPKDQCKHGKRKKVRTKQKTGKNKGKMITCWFCKKDADDPEQCEPNFGDMKEETKEETQGGCADDIPW